jgi:hypothetical protein
MAKRRREREGWGGIERRGNIENRRIRKSRGE